MGRNPFTGAIDYETDDYPASLPAPGAPIEQECYPGDEYCRSGVSYYCDRSGFFKVGGDACGTSPTLVQTVMSLSSPSGSPITQGSDVLLSGTVKTSSGTPVPSISVSVFAVGTDYENRWVIGTVVTDSQGRFSMTIPGSHYSAISLGPLNLAQAGAIFFGNTTYKDCEAYKSFLVNPGSPCPDGVDDSACYASSACELGTDYCENGVLLECKQKKNCQTCYVQKGTCKLRSYMYLDSQSHTEIQQDDGMFEFNFHWETETGDKPCRTITFAYRAQGSSSAWIPLQHTNLTPVCSLWGVLGKDYNLQFDAKDFPIGDFKFRARYEGSTDIGPCEKIAYLKVRSSAPPVCEEGVYFNPYSCWDGSTIYLEQCVYGKLQSTGQVCPVKVCNEGEFSTPVECSDGSTIYDKVCSGNKWVSSGQVCPTCVDGERIEFFTCPDGTVIAKKVCVDGEYMDSGETCPSACANGAMKCVDGLEYVCQGNAWVPTGNACGGGLGDKKLIIAAAAIGIGVVALALVVK